MRVPCARMTTDIFFSYIDRAPHRFEDIRYRVKTKDKGEVEILHGINGCVRSGEVLAILGPSGAGKTCLIDALTMEMKGGENYGKVTLNGEDLTREVFTRNCASMTQQDNHWAFLTCRETLDYAADLCVNDTMEKKRERIDAILTTVGLMDCADTKVGNQFLKGLSGGQKRRLSLAVSLLTDPKVLFLDEPTSGLDAAAAAAIMAFLKELAQQTNIAIVCTIHQPSTAVFNGFDRVMLLSTGRVAYLGTSKDVLPYFDKIGHKMPANTNPAEFMLDLVNREFTDPKQVDYILDKYEKAYTGLPCGNYEDDLKETGGVGKNEHLGNSLFTETMALFRRHGLLVFRDPTLYVARAFMFLNACVFFGIIYIKSRERDQDQIFSRMWLLVWHIGVPTSLGVVAVYSYNEEFSAIKREIKNGMLRPFSYLFSNALIQIPLMLFLGMCAISVSGYGMADWYAPHYVQTLLVYALMLWAYEAAAQVFSICFTNPLIGMLVYMNLWFGGFLFNGILIDEKDVVWPFRAFTFVNIMKWALRAIVYLEYADATFKPCTESDLLCFSNSAETALGTGAKVPGSEVLDSMGKTYRLYSNDDTVAFDAVVTLALGLGFKLWYFYLFYTKTRKVKEIKPQIGNVAAGSAR